MTVTPKSSLQVSCMESTHLLVHLALVSRVLLYVFGDASSSHSADFASGIHNPGVPDVLRPVSCSVLMQDWACKQTQTEAQPHSVIKLVGEDDICYKGGK